MEELKKQTHLKQNQAYLDKEIYQHILNRMKYDQVAHTIKI